MGTRRVVVELSDRTLADVVDLADAAGQRPRDHLRHVLEEYVARSRHRQRPRLEPEDSLEQVVTAA
jgi:hypothetical protein